MSEHMKKRLIKNKPSAFWVSDTGDIAKLPQRLIKEMEKYLVTDKKEINQVKRKVQAQLGESPDSVFFEINKQNTKVGSLLKGFRYREGLSQVDFAKKISITLGDLSKIENGKRPIGKDLAKRIAEFFKTDYRKFL